MALSVHRKLNSKPSLTFLHLEDSISYPASCLNRIIYGVRFKTEHGLTTGLTTLHVLVLMCNVSYRMLGTRVGNDVLQPSDTLDTW